MKKITVNNTIPKENTRGKIKLPEGFFLHSSKKTPRSGWGILPMGPSEILFAPCLYAFLCLLLEYKKTVFRSYFNNFILRTLILSCARIMCLLSWWSKFLCIYVVKKKNFFKKEYFNFCVSIFLINVYILKRKIQILDLLFFLI